MTLAPDVSDGISASCSMFLFFYNLTYLINVIDQLLKYNYHRFKKMSRFCWNLVTWWHNIFTIKQHVWTMTPFYTAFMKSAMKLGVFWEKRNQGPLCQCWSCLFAVRHKKKHILASWKFVCWENSARRSIWMFIGADLIQLIRSADNDNLIRTVVAEIKFISEIILPCQWSQ